MAAAKLRPLTITKTLLVNYHKFLRLPINLGQQRESANEAK